MVGEIGELVHDEVRGEADDGVDERDSVEHVADDGQSPEGCDDRSLVGSAGHARHLVAGAMEQRQQSGADDPGCSGHEHPHHDSSSVPSSSAVSKCRCQSSEQTEIVYSR